MKPEKTESTHQFNPYWLEQGYGARSQVFQNLMRFRVRNILLVSSLYDLFLLEEDGRLYELLREEYQELNLTHTPELTRVSSGKQALALVRQSNQFDLIITTPHIEDMPVNKFAKKVRAASQDLPIVILAYDHRELTELGLYHDTSIFDQMFVWQGDFRLLIAIIKYVEDKRNVQHDTETVGVQSIILVEDRVQYYSSFLPIIYVELFKQARRLISEGINLSHRFLRMRARPKILLCTTYEEAWSYFKKYRESILGIVSDINYPRKGKHDPVAGLKFAKHVKRLQFDIPILLQSSTAEHEKEINELGCSFLLKGSPTLLQELRQFMVDHFGFGEFVFRRNNGLEVGRAHDLQSLEEQLKSVPDDSIKYHSERNHFSKWLKARTEFWLALQLRPRQLEDFESVDGLRDSLIKSVHAYRANRQLGIITDFKKELFYPLSSFARIGGGSLGGKARGLSFLNKLIYNYKINDHFTGVNIYVPPAVVLGTEIFERFLDENKLHDFALKCTDDHEIIRRFLEAQIFPVEAFEKLKAFLEIVETPLAVRSSSLLEDSQYYPFAGVYNTFMLANNNKNLDVRLFELLNAVKRVYASTFSRNAKSYFRATTYRLEEERMAVVIQKMVGGRHQDRFYPDLAGVVKSYNFYPVGPQQASDGLASVALGLGKTVVDGGNHVKFSPKYPQHLPQFASVTEALNNNQQHFYALNLMGRSPDLSESKDTLLERFGLEQAEEDGTLKYAGSTYSPQNNAIYDGISRPGQRLVTFAPILKHKLFPLPEILQYMLEMGSWAMGTPVELEFAVSLSPAGRKIAKFGLLQLRPMALRHELEALEFDEVDDQQVICRSDRVLGHGVAGDIYDVVVIDPKTFDRLNSREAAREVSIMNQKLVARNAPYVLIGVGRWGSLDPFLGIPVRWEQISGARAIVEAGFDDLAVMPSQGSHFFHNLTSFNVGYFTVAPHAQGSSLCWEWLRVQPVAESMLYTRLLHFDSPVVVKMNGRKNEGVILKPE